MPSAPTDSIKEKINVVFLHGYCEGSWIWNDLLSFLPESFNYHALNLPGTGDNNTLPEFVTLEAVAAGVWKTLEDRNILNPVLIGHSLGGYVALAMTEARPQFVKGIVLFHSMPFADTDARKESRNKVIELVSRSGKEPFLNVFAPGLFYDPDSELARDFRKRIESTTAETIIFYAAAMRDRSDRMAVLKVFRNPVLLIGGVHDLIISREVLEAVAGQLSGAEICFLTASAHAGMLEEPGKSAEIIENFTKKCFPEP
ncbi:MAG: alpha/beta fold hydrolase [Cyclobacteriaceae bacterium]